MRRVIAMMCMMGVVLSLFGGCSVSETPTESAVKAPVSLGFQFEKPQEGEEFAIIRTDAGDIYVRLFPDQAPKAVENFKTLAKNGYYDGVLFHRIVEDMFVQTGDPTGKGDGGESCWGGWFEDEFSPVLGHFRGSLAMANGGANMNGSQFFINQAGVDLLPVSAERQYYQDNAAALTDYASFEEYYAAKVEYITGEDGIDPAKLTAEVLDAYDTYGGNIALDHSVRTDGGYTVFGQVFYGMDAVDTIASAEVDTNDRPTDLVCIETIDFAVYQHAFYPHFTNAQTQTKNKVTETEEAFGFQLELPAIGEEIVVIHTSVGDISLRLFPDHAPKAVENFKTLIEEEYYDGVSFSVVNGMLATLNETSLSEAHGGAVMKSSFGEFFEDEFCTSLGNLYGAVSMTNAGPDSNSVRFFFNNGKSLSATLENLRLDYETNQAKLSTYYTSFAPYFADRYGFDISRVTDEVLAVYEAHGGNIDRDGTLHVTSGNTVFAQVFDGLDVMESITDAPTADDGITPTDDIVIESVELTTYQG